MRNTWSLYYTPESFKMIRNGSKLIQDNKQSAHINKHTVWYSNLSYSLLALTLQWIASITFFFLSFFTKRYKWKLLFLAVKFFYESQLRGECSICKGAIPELETIIVRMKVITAAEIEHPSCISWELQSNGAFCLCRFLHSLAAAGSSGRDSGLCVWSDVHGYQHTSVSLHHVYIACVLLCNTK